MVRRRRLAAVALLGLLAACGSDDDATVPTQGSAQVEELIAALRATADPGVLAEFDAATQCLRETFTAGYAPTELQVLTESVKAQDLSRLTEELRQRFNDDAVSCNEENRALDPADYQEDAQQLIADAGMTNPQCALPTDISVGATFECTGNFENRTREFRATIDAVGHVVIERTDEN